MSSTSKRGRGRPKSRVSGPMPFTADEQATILEFLGYVMEEAISGRAALIKWHGKTRRKAMPEGGIDHYRKMEGVIDYLAARATQKFRRRRLVDGVLMKHYAGEVA